MKAKEWLKQKGINPIEPIYWDILEGDDYVKDQKRVSLDELMDEFAGMVSNQQELLVGQGVYSADDLLADFEEWFDDQNIITIGLLDDYTDSQEKAFWEGLRCAGLELKHCIKMNKISGSK